MTLSEQNILIAKFMGFELIRVGYVGQNDGDVDDETDWQRENDRWLDEVGISSVGRYIVNVPEKKWFLWEDVRYDESWEWLMPVVEKIETLKAPGDFIISQVSITSHTCNVNYNNGKVTTHNLPHYNETRHRPETETKIDNVFATVVEFIQWYNTQNTSPT